MLADALRFFTMALILAAFVTGIRLCRLQPELRPILSYVLGWAANVMVFYSVYILTNRWQGVYQSLHAYWPALLLMHAALVAVVTLRMAFRDPDK